MFTGIVEAMGKIIQRDATPGLHTLVIYSPQCCDDLHLGDSIAVNGVCLTVMQLDAENKHFSVQAVPETLSRTNLGDLKINDFVNLERSMRADTRMGGHFVQGHVDTVSEILSVEKQGEALLVKLSLSAEYARYVVNKGFIAMDGMSLTVIEAENAEFSVTLIPYTITHTVAQFYQVGKKVNLEIDILSKYVERLLSARNNTAI